MPKTGLLVIAALVLVAEPTVASAQTWRDFTVSRVRSGEEVLEVNIEYGAGELIEQVSLSAADGRNRKIGLHSQDREDEAGSTATH